MIRCNVCQIEKEETDFQKYWHSTQNKFRIRKQCTNCLYDLRLKRKNPEKYYENNPNYKKCLYCKEWKELSEYYKDRTKNKPQSKCIACEKESHRKEREMYLIDNGGSSRVPPKPNTYADEYQKFQTFEFLKLLNYEYNEEKGIWVKPNVKEIIDDKVVFINVRNAKFKKKNYTVKLTPEAHHKIIQMHLKGKTYFEIAIELDINTSTAHQIVKKWKALR